MVYFEHLQKCFTNFTRSALKPLHGEHKLFFVGVSQHFFSPSSFFSRSSCPFSISDSASFTKAIIPPKGGDRISSINSCKSRGEPLKVQLHEKINLLPETVLYNGVKKHIHPSPTYFDVFLCYLNLILKFVNDLKNAKYRL